MTKLWKALCIAVVAAGLAAPTQVQAQGFSICDIFPAFPGCGDQVTQEDLDALQEQIDALAAALGTTNEDLQNALEQIEDLEELTEAQAALIQAIIDEAFGGDCEFLSEGELETCDSGCSDTDTDVNNCGGCAETGGDVCGVGEQCDWGDCEPIPCDPPTGDPDFDCNTAIRDEEGECSYTPANEGGGCNDHNACTDTDECTGGLCLGTGNPCDPGETCGDVDGVPVCTEED